MAIGLISREPQAQRAYFMPATCALLGAAVLLAPFMSSVLKVASLLGAATGTTMCFVMPGAILLHHKSRRTRSHALQRAGAWGVVVLGAALFVSGIASSLIKR